MLGDRVIAREALDDATVFEAFAARKLDASYRIATLILGDPTDAEDATHDAFVAAWRDWATLRDREKVDAWFGRILVHRCRDLLRRRKRRPVVDVSAELLDLPARGDLSLEAADREAIGRGFASLEADQRICLVLRYYADLSVRQIAEQTGVPEGTVKSRLHRALRELRITLIADGIEGPR